MTIYQVWIVSYASDSYSSEWGDKYFLFEKDAEDYIFKKGLLDEGYQDVYVKEIRVNEGPI